MIAFSSAMGNIFLRCIAKITVSSVELSQPVIALLLEIGDSLVHCHLGVLEDCVNFSLRSKSRLLGLIK